MKFKLLLLLTGLLLVLPASTVVGQVSVNNYIFSTTNTGSMMLDQNGNTVDMSSGTTQVIGPNVNSAGSGLFTFGFDFFYFGTRYTQVSVSSNGLIGIGNAVVAGANAFLGGNNRISVFNSTAFTGTDMGTGATGKVHWKVVGTAPNRCLVMEWLNMNITSTSGTLDATFQARLYETSGSIEFVYANMAVGANGPITRHIGISNTTTIYQMVNTTTNTAAVNTTIPNVYNNGVIADVNSASDGNRRRYSWTPTSSATAGPLTFTAVNAIGMTVNWADIATDEVGYVVHMSSDGGATYNYLTTTAANATSYVATGLTPSTTYLWRVYTLREALSSPSTGSQATPPVGAVTAISSGLWSQTTTWSSGTIPTPGDSVVIASGFTVTIDMAAVAYSVNIDGVLEYESAVARTLTTGGSVYVNAGGQFNSNAVGTITTHNLTVGRNLINNGSINFSTNTNTAGATITFNQANQSNFTLGATSTTNLRNLTGVTVNKGTSIASGINFSPNGTITVEGANTFGFMAITNGLVELSGTYAFTNPLFSAATYTIPATAGFRLNNPNAIIVGQAGNATTNGLLRISSGTMIIGNSLNNSLGFGAGAIFTVDGGNITSAGRIQTANAITFNLSSGNIGVGAVGQNAATATFGLTSATNTLNISGGTINLIQRSTNATPLDYSVNGTANITGGTLIVGNSATATNFDFRIQGTTPNLTIDNTTNVKQALASGVLTVNGNVNVLAGSTLNGQTFNIIVQGNINQIGNVVNDGIITNTTATGANRFQFSSGFGAQTYSGSGTFGTLALAYSGISVQNSAGVAINSPIVTNRVNLFNGVITNSANISVGFGGASSPTIQVGGTAGLIAGSFDVAPTFNIGTGGLSVVYATSLAAVNTSNEIPATRSVANITISNSNGVTLTGGNLNITTNITFTAGQFITNASNIPTVTATVVGGVTGGSATSFVNGPFEITLPASLVTGSTYRLPIGKTAYNEMALVNPTTNAGGNVVIRAEVFDANSGGTAGVGITTLSTNRYWESSFISGGANFINTTIALQETGLVGGNRIGQSGTVNGTYNNIGGTVVAPTITSNVVTTLGFLNIGVTSSTLSGTYLVGASQPTYQKLTQVAAALNSMVVTGDVTFIMMPDYDGTIGETFPIVFNAYSNTGTYNVKIRPDAASVNLNTSGDPGTGNTLIRLDGVNRLTFDGRPGGIGTTSQWLFRNTRTAATVGSTFTFINDANLDTLEYLKIEGQNTGAANATVLFSTSTGTIGNSNNVIFANDIRDRSDFAGVPNTAIASSGSAGAPNNNNKISGNTIRNYTSGGIVVSANSNSWTVGGSSAAEGNNLFQEAARTTAIVNINFSTGNTHTIGFNNIYQTAGVNSASNSGINVTGAGNGHSIFGNSIGGSNASRTGAAMYNTAGATSNGINIAAGTGSLTNVYNNRISNFGVLPPLLTTTLGVANGILVSAGNVNVGGLGGNIIGGAAFTGVPSDTLVTSYDNGWINISGGTVTVENNTVSNAAYYRNTNDRNAGIYVSGGTPIVRNNTVAAIKGNNNSSTGSTFISSGITATIAGAIIENNIVSDIWNFNTVTNSVHVAGINVTTASSTTVIRGNRISNIRSTGTQTGANAPIVNGIYLGSSNPSVYNNRVSIGMNSSGETRITGIYENTTANPAASINYNTVYVTGTSTSGANNSYAFKRNSTGAISLRNNLFYNERTGGTGNHYAIGNSAGAPATNWTATTSNNNYFVTLNASAVGEWGIVAQTLAAWKTNVLPGDANSYSNTPAFIPSATLFVDPNTANLKINPAFYSIPSDIESKGLGIPTITTDFESDVRPGPIGSVNGGGTAPDIGADEFDGVPVTFDVGVLAMVNPSATGCKTATEVVRFRIRNYSTVTLNLSTNPITLTSSVSGPNPMAFPVVILNSGTLAASSNFDTAVTFTYDMTLAGTYVFNASAALTGDNNPSNNALAPIPNIVVGGGTATANPSSVCAFAGSTINLSTSGATAGSTYQWYISQDAVSWTAIPTATTNPFAYSDTSTTGDTLYFQVISCGLHASTVDTVIVSSPSAPIANDTSRCGPGYLDLYANGSGTLNWYNVPTGGSVIDTGIVYTPYLNATDTFYVENVSGGSGTANVGAPNNSIGTGLNSTAPQWLIFDVLAPTTIQSMVIYPWAAGNVTLEQRLSDGVTIVNSYTHTVTAGEVGTPVTIPVNWTVTPGTGYRLYRSGTPSLYRNDAGASYPYTIPGVISITGNSFNPAYYYWGYNWTVASGCASARTPVVATVTPSASINAYAVSGGTTCNNEADTLVVTSANTSYQYWWTPSIGLTDSTAAITAANPLSTTTYYLEAIDSANCRNLDTVTIVVNASPVIQLFASDSAICYGDTATIFLQQGPYQYSDSTSVNIPDATPAGINSAMLNVSGVTSSMITTSIDSVCFNMTHTFDADMDIYLVSPAGTQIVLMADEGGANDNFVGTCFKPTAVVPIVGAAAPFTGAFIPEDVAGFAAFNGENANGNWYLHLVDDLGGDVGVLENWSITFTAPTYTYSWNSSGGPLTDTTASITVNPTVNTTYYLTATDPVNGCEKVDTIALVVYAPVGLSTYASPLITCMAGNDTLVAVPSGGMGNYTFLWSDFLGTNDSAFVSGLPFDYTVGVTLTDGCGSVTDSVLIDIADPMSVASTDTANCGPGSGFVLSSNVVGGNGVYTYSWTGGSTSSSMTTGTVSATQNYTVTVTDGCGSTSTSVSTVTINTLPIVNLGPDIIQPSPPAILDAGAGFSSYLWNTTATTQTISVTTNGSYTVTVTDANGCTNSDVIQVNFTAGINNPDGSTALVSYYPNPTNGILNMNIQGFMGEELKMEVMDLQGKIIKNYVFSEVTENYLQQIDLSTLRAGTYIVMLHTITDSYAHRIVITNNY